MAQLQTGLVTSYRMLSNLRHSLTIMTKATRSIATFKQDYHAKQKANDFSDHINDEWYDEISTLELNDLYTKGLRKLPYSY